MPFKIIRNDITKVKADAIVNTANPKPVYGGGTDTAIYQAAGVEQLLVERQKIGEIARGNVAVTPAFDLQAKYIIHTVGPKWIDGENGEFTTLENCYKNSLDKAVELGCKSIAFPLISTGVYGFPKDKALQIAVSVFSRFLMEYEMQITLVVFDKTAFQLSSNLVGEVDAYIDSHYVKKKYASEYSNRVSSASRRRMYHEVEELSEEEELEVRASYKLLEPMESCTFKSGDPEESLSLDEALENMGATFHDKLFELIDMIGIDNKDVYKRANLDRKHFSKIQCDPNYHPKKKTVMALCIALQLDLEQSKDLMARADWAFSPSSKVDLIVQKAIVDKQYDIYQLNMVLFKYTNEILGN